MGDLSKFCHELLQELRILHILSALQLQRDGAFLGTALMPNLTLYMGNNSLTSTSDFEVIWCHWLPLRPLMTSFSSQTAPKGCKRSAISLAGPVRGFLRQASFFGLNITIDVDIAITGFNGSTQVDSLLPAFERLNITTTLPGLKTGLLSGGSLESRSSRTLFCWLLIICQYSQRASIRTISARLLWILLIHSQQALK